jgi:alpha-beta hydrolase superfamily lysophospholipase
VKRALLVAAAAVVGLYLSIVAFFAVAQRSLIFPAPGGHRMQRSRVLEGQGFRAIWVPPPSAGAGLVVHFHGNGEDLAGLDPVIDLFRSVGVGCLAVEYPGYGVSRAEGPPSEEAFYRTAVAAVAYAREYAPASGVILSGQSLGTGVASELAARGLGSKLILISPFTSMAEVAAVHFPWLPVRLLLRDRFETASKAARIGVPVLLIHGSEDEVVPAWMSEDLEKFLSRATRRLIEGAHHNDLLSTHRERLGAAISGFLRETAPERSPRDESK